MARYLSVVIGGLLVIIGIILFITNRYEFMVVLRGVGPLFLVFAGLIAFFAGLAEIKDRAALKKEGKL